MPLALMCGRAPRTAPTMIATISRIVKKLIGMINLFRRYHAGLVDITKIVIKLEKEAITLTRF